MRHFKTIDWSISLSLLFACVLTVIVACVEPSGVLDAPNVVVDVRAISSVQITLAQSTLAPGQTTQATVVTTSADGKVVPSGRIDFSSQNPLIATVSSKGLVTAVAAGIAVIQATVSGHGASASLTVQSLGSPVASVAAVAVAFDSTKISVGHVAQASAVVKDTAGNAITGQTITWSSLTPNLASVSSSGAVTAIAAGTASIKAAVSGITGSASIIVEQPPVATVIVTVDSTTLSIGHTAQAFATAKDSAGNPINGQTVIWTSLSPSLASVSSSGQITALAVGIAVIQATISGCSGSSPLEIRSASSASLPPDLAFSDFNDGTWGPYYASMPADEDVVSDPTGSGRGMVARFHYIGTNQDRNRSLEYDHTMGYGATLHFRGEFYIPVSDLALNGIQRKLIYWQDHVDYTKYGGTGGVTMTTVVVAFGSSLRIDSKYIPQNGNVDSVRTAAWIGAPLVGNRWYTLEVQQTNESSIGAADGILRIWLDGTLLFEKTTMQWTDLAWIGQIPPGTTKNVIFDPSDVYFERFEVGDQVNWSGTYDEYRYWDNVAFSTQRIGK